MTEGKQIESENCFVIQPFDGGVYDKRYKDVLEPAIKAAGMEPYRVDQDPSASIPIERIESGIKESVAVLADITENNPNVWFEVGYAIAAGKEVVFVCSRGREAPFPFDVQHRNIIQYATDSLSDFADLRKKLVARLKAAAKKSVNLAELRALSPLKDQEGLTPFEISALVVVMENRLTPTTSVSPEEIKKYMNRLGYRDIAVSLALAGLMRKDMLEIIEEPTDFGSYTAYLITDKGIEWIVANQDKLILENKPARATPNEITDEDIPF